MTMPNESLTLAPRSGTPATRLPSVNLLSPDTLVSLAVRQVRRRLVAAGLVGAVLIGGGWAVQSMRLSGAKDDLAAEQAQAGPLQQQLAALDPVAKFVSGLDARKQAASKAMAAEVLFSEALVDLNKRTPNGVKLSSISVTLTPSVVTSVAPPVSPLAKANGTAAKDTAPKGTAATAADNPATATAASAVSCARPDPFRPAAIIGCVTISGTAPSRDAVGKFVDNLKAGKIYADPFVTTTTVSGADGTKQIQFSGSVGLTGALVSGRYVDLSWLSDPKVLAAAEKLVAAGSSAGAKLDEQADALAELKQAQAEAAQKAKERAEAEAAAKAAKEAEKQQQAILDALDPKKTAEGQ